MSNVADISVFEDLQATQNAKFGMSPMNVFNARHRAFNEGNGGLDFHIESYAGDEARFPDVEPIVTKEQKDELYRKYGSEFSTLPFMAVLTERFINLILKLIKSKLEM